MFHIGRGSYSTIKTPTAGSGDGDGNSDNETLLGGSKAAGAGLSSSAASTPTEGFFDARSTTETPTFGGDGGLLDIDTPSPGSADTIPLTGRVASNTSTTTTPQRFSVGKAGGRSSTKKGRNSNRIPSVLNVGGNTSSAKNKAPSSSSSAAKKTPTGRSPHRARRERREKWAGRTSAALPSPTSSPSFTANRSASRDFGAGVGLGAASATPRPNTSATATTTTTAASASASTATATAYTTSSTGTNGSHINSNNSESVNNNNGVCSFRDLLQSVAATIDGANTTTNDSVTQQDGPMAMDEDENGSHPGFLSPSTSAESSSDKENDTDTAPSGAAFSTSSTRATSLAAAAAARFPNPYSLPRGPEMIESIIARLPQALNLGCSSSGSSVAAPGHGDDAFELDETCYREIAEALLRCHLRKRSAPNADNHGRAKRQEGATASASASSPQPPVDPSTPARTSVRNGGAATTAAPSISNMSPCRKAACKAAEERRSRPSSSASSPATPGTANRDSNANGNGSDGEESWVDVNVTRSSSHDAKVDKVDVTRSSSFDAQMNKEAQFFDRMKIDGGVNGEGEMEHKSNDTSEGIGSSIADRVQRLNLNGGVASSKSFSDETGHSPTQSSSGTTNAASSTHTGKVSNLKGLWEELSSPDPKVKTGVEGASMSPPAVGETASAEDRTVEEVEMKTPPVDATATKLAKEMDAEAEDKQRMACNSNKDAAEEQEEEAEAASLPDVAAAASGATDEHGFPSTAEGFPSPPIDASFDTDKGPIESSFFFSPEEKINAAASDLAASSFAFATEIDFDEQGLESKTPGPESSDSMERIKPLKPPNTNAKQGKMRRKVVSAISGTEEEGQFPENNNEEGPKPEDVNTKQQTVPLAVDPSLHFSVDLSSKTKENGIRKQGKSKGQRASMVAPTPNASSAAESTSPKGSPMDVDMEGTTPPRSERHSSAEEAMLAAARVAAAEAAAANVDEAIRNDFSIGSSDPSPQKSPRNRAGRNRFKNKTKGARAPLAASLSRSAGGAGGSSGMSGGLNTSYESTMPFCDPYAPPPTSAAPPVSVGSNLHDDVDGLEKYVAALRDEGRELYLERRYTECIIRYTGAIKALTRNFTVPRAEVQNPEMLALLLSNRAAALVMVGAFDAATGDCRKALEYVPDENASNPVRIAPIWDLKAESGPALRSKLLCRMGRALLKAGKVDAAEEVFEATIRTAEDAFAKYGKTNLDVKANNVMDQSIADATLNKADLKRFREEIAQIDKLCTGLSPDIAAQRYGAQILVHINNALSLAPGNVELHTQKIRLLACMKRWADVAFNSEKFAAEAVKLDGAFVYDLERANPFPSVPPAGNLSPDFFDMAALDATTNTPKTIDSNAAGEAALRMAPPVCQIYLRALRLEERYAEASQAFSTLEAHIRLTKNNSRFQWLKKEQEKLRRTIATKDGGDELFKKGRYEQAAAKYASCLLIDSEGDANITSPDGSNAGGRLHAVLHCNRAASFMAMKNHREAAKECTYALQIHSLYMKAMFRRARCQSHLGHYEEAISELQRYISLVETAARNPQGPAYAESNACYFDLPNQITSDEYERAKKELADTKKAQASKLQAEAAARARAERERWYEDNLRGDGGGGGGAGGSDAYRRRQQWYDSAGNESARRWDSFNGSSPKKPNGTRSHSNRSPPRASYQQQRSHSYHHHQQQSQQTRDPLESNIKGRTHYEVLGVSRSSTLVEIKKAYRKLVLKHHPDKGGSAEDFNRLDEAYKTLSDEGSRRKYDAELRYGRF